MDRNQAKEFYPFLQAFAEGTVIFFKKVKCKKLRERKSSENPKKPVFSMDLEDYQTNFHKTGG